MSDSMKEVVESLDPVARQLLPSNLDLGTLVPLKTTLELRDNLNLGYAYVTRAPTKCTNDIVGLVRESFGEDVAKSLPHLRRCSKPADLPPHVKSQFANEGTGNAVHIGKSNWLYIMLGPKDDIPFDKLVSALSSVDGVSEDLFVGVIPVPMMPPTSQVQANMWSQQYWQTVYRKNNPLGPHPSNVCRTTTAVSRDASVWMTLAHQIARKAQKTGLGEPVGAVIIKRPGSKERGPSGKGEGKIDWDDAAGSGENTSGESPTTATSADSNPPPLQPAMSGLGAPDTDSSKAEPDEKETAKIVAIAADARWHQQEKTGHTGNPMAHASMRAISMVAQKLVRAERGEQTSNDIFEFEAFQDRPLLSDEQVVFEADHPSPDGYLCHDLELYMTHEPCTMCAMAILHSRVGRIVFRHRMPLTGGMSSEDRRSDLCGTSCPPGSCGGGQGLGLHWRKELNWSMLGWEWETDNVAKLHVDPHLHA